MTTADRVEYVRIDRDNANLLERVADDVFDDEIVAAGLDAVIQSGQLLVVATRDGIVVGQVQGMIQHHVDGPPQLYLDNLGVSPSHQREGIARGLVHEARAWSRELGCAATWIVAELDNEPADGFYRALGARRSSVALYALD